MLRHIYVYKNDSLLYSKKYGKISGIEELNNFLENLKSSNQIDEINYVNYKKYKFSVLSDETFSLTILFINDITDDFTLIKAELSKFNRDLITILEKDSKENLKPLLGNIVKNIQKRNPLTIALVGNQGVGKTEIANLVKSDKFPTTEDKSISANRIEFSIGDFFFKLRDFTGKENFIFLWKNFIKNVNCVLIVTDSSLYDIQKSKDFIKTIYEENPYAYIGVLANKRDINKSLNIAQIEGIFGIQTHPITATDPNSRFNFIESVFKVMEVFDENQLILKSYIRRERLIEQYKAIFENQNDEAALFLYDQIIKLTHILNEDPEQLDVYSSGASLKGKIVREKNEQNKSVVEFKSLPEVERNLKTLLLNYMKNVSGILATVICDRDGFIFTSESKKHVEDETTLGAVAAAVDSYIDRIKGKFGNQSEFFNITIIGNNKFAYCSVGPKSILATISDLSATDTELRVYSEHVANKIELLLEKSENVSLEIPEIIKFLGKTKDGKIPKGSFSTKLIIIGDYLVGKTSLISRYVQNLFREEYQSTVGVNISQKTIKLTEDTKMKFVIWDIGGQITKMAKNRKRFYEGTNSAFIVIDRTRSETLESVEIWYNDLKKHLSKDVNILLIGNKSDLVDEIVVSEADLIEVANLHNFNYILTSALTGKNVNEAFLYAAYKFIENF